MNTCNINTIINSHGLYSKTSFIHTIKNMIQNIEGIDICYFF